MSRNAYECPGCGRLIGHVRTTNGKRRLAFVRDVSVTALEESPTPVYICPGCRRPVHFSWRKEPRPAPDAASERRAAATVLE